MSEEEYSEEEYEEEEVEVEEAEAEPEHHEAQSKRSQRASETVDNENLNEGEKAFAAAKKRHEDDDMAKLQDYEQKRRNEREREEEELKILKEKQEQRRLQREEEERELAERRKQDEERRLRDEEERKARMEAERKKKEEEKMKRAQMAGGFSGGTGGRNFVVPEKKDKSDKFGNIVQAKQEMGMTKEQQEDAKEAFLSALKKQFDIDSLSSSDLKAKIKEMHHRICKLEADKYDLEKRHDRQTYDLRELNERQRNATKHNRRNIVDPADAGGRHPPKIAVVNKYDRQTDRRNFRERRQVYDKRGAFPCFPNVPPPPTILEFKPKKEVKYDVYQNVEPEEEEEEYEEEDEEE